MDRAAVRPDVCPQPTAGATVRLVCAFSSPLLGAGFTVGWCGPCLGYLHTARLVVLGIWRISRGGSTRCTGAGGAGSARFASDGPLREGPYGTRRDGSAEAQLWVFVRCKQVPWQELVPFGILAGGWAREKVFPSAFVPCQAELCPPGLNNSPSRCPPALLFSDQSC